MCSSNLAFEGLVLRSLRASPLMKPFLTPGVKVRVLEGLCWFKVRAHIKNRVPFESPLYTRLQECYFSI